MARSTRKPQTYQTSAAILALSSNDQFDLVMGSAGTPTWAVVRTSAGLDYARVVSLWPDKVQAEAAGRALYAERGYLDPVIYIGLAQPWVTEGRVIHAVKDLGGCLRVANPEGKGMGWPAGSM
jgi:hypothetical protein